MHHVQERLRILFARAPSPIAIPLHTRLDDMEGRIRGVHEGCVYIGARVHCAGRESRNNNDNNDRDDNIGSKIRRGEREEKYVRWILGFAEASKQPSDIWLCQFSEPVVRLAPSIDTDYVLLLADSHHERGTQWD